MEKPESEDLSVGLFLSPFKCETNLESRSGGLVPDLSCFMLAIGLIVTVSFFIYEATSPRKNRSLAKELTTGAVASVFLGFGSLYLLLASGVYV